METKTYKFPENLLNRLSYIITSHAIIIESSERWSQDRDESFKWHEISSIISHLSGCPFRKQLTNGKSISLTLELDAWNSIKKVLKEKFEKRYIHFIRLYIQKKLLNLKKSIILLIKNLLKR